MYRITKDGASLGMTEAPTYIKQAPNGCLVLCPENEATGIAWEGKVYGLLGREEDTVICWDEIQCIGEDTVLVKYCPPPGSSSCRRRDSLLDRLFG